MSTTTYEQLRAQLEAAARSYGGVASGYVIGLRDQATLSTGAPHDPFLKMDRRRPVVFTLCGAELRANADIPPSWMVVLGKSGEPIAMVRLYLGGAS